MEPVRFSGIDSAKVATNFIYIKKNVCCSTNNRKSVTASTPHWSLCQAILAAPVFLHCLEGTEEESELISRTRPVGFNRICPAQCGQVSLWRSRRGNRPIRVLLDLDHSLPVLLRGCLRRSQLAVVRSAEDIHIDNDCAHWPSLATPLGSRQARTVSKEVAIGKCRRRGGKS